MPLPLTALPLAPLPLMNINYGSPLFWAVMVGWIISVTLHELAHGIAAYAGGDYTIGERGGLTLNPLHYAHPFTTFVLPVMFMLVGGIPLVGGATSIDTKLLRSKGWQSLVSAAGPLSNLLLCLLCVVPLYPGFGWVHFDAPPSQWSSPQIFLGAMALLQMEVFLLNLLPLPPLDGFGIIEPYLPRETQELMNHPQVRWLPLIALFLVLQTQTASYWFSEAVFQMFTWLHVSQDTQAFILKSFYFAMFGETG